MRALVWRWLLDRRRSIVAWGVSGGLLCALTAALYPAVQDSIGRAVAGYPKGLKQAFGIGRLSTVEEYLSAEAFSLIVPLAISYFAIRSVVRALPAAEEAGHLDVLLSAPVSRRHLALASFATTGLALVGVLALIGAFTWISGTIAGADPSLGLVAAGALNLLPLALFFAGIATVATGLARGAAFATGVAAGTLITMYVVDLLGKLADGAASLRYLSVFKYYGSAIVDGIDPLAFTGIGLVAVALAALGAFLLDRRDVLG